MTQKPESSMTEPVPEAIRASLRQRNVVLFCGAGISMEPPATLPDWKTFRDETIKAVASVDKWLPEVAPKLLNREMIAPGKQGLAPEVIASQVRAVVPGYFRCLRALDHDQWNRNHAIIAHLARAGLVTQIVTTNFDQLIEKALTSLGVLFQVCRSEEDFENRAKEGSTTGVEVFKLHGCLSDPDTIVATVEQEAVGLSPAKAEVMRQLWAGRTVLFWGYSGADLKVRPDYLQIAASGAALRDVFWILHSTPTWQEKPLPELLRLMESIPGKGIIHHCNLPQILTALLESEATFSPFPPPAEGTDDVRRRRNEDLTASIRAWAGTSLKPQQSLEIFARLLERVGELDLASVCWDRLYQVEVKETGDAAIALKAKAMTEGAALLCRLGLFAKAEQIQHIGREQVVSVGSIDLLIISARTDAEILGRQGLFVGSIQPRAFSHYISRWASRRGRIIALELDLTTIDFFLSRGLVNEAAMALAALEQEARNAGLLEILGRARALHSRLHSLFGEQTEAIQCIREAEEIALALGLERDAQLLKIRRALLEGPSGAPDSGEPIDIPDVMARIKSAENRFLASQLAFEILETVALDPKEALELIAAVQEYVEEDDVKDIRASHGPLVLPLPLTEDFKHDTLVRLSLHKSRVYRQVGNDEAEVAAIERALPKLTQAGYEYIAAELHTRLAQLKQQAGGGARELLSYFETAAASVRIIDRHVTELEDELARIRVELGNAQYPENYDQFLSDWLGEKGLMQQMSEALLYQSHREAELPTGVALNVGEVLESRYGKSGRFTWSLWKAAVICEASRRDGQAEAALEIVNRSLPMARQLADNFLIGVFHNQAGFNLTDLGRKEEALKHFELAIEAGEKTGDNLRLVHYYQNAASTNTKLGKFDAALDYYARLTTVVARRQDFTAYLDLSLGSGEALKALGRREEARAHIEHAEYCAWMINDQDLIFKTNRHLGKLYWDLRELEASIACRVACMQLLKSKGDHKEAGSYALLVANTYDRELGRAPDAVPYYQESIALLEGVDAGLADTARARLAQCQSQPRKLRPWLYPLLMDHAGSEEAAEWLAIRIALHLGRWLWHFELRSWAAWCERNLPPLLIGFAMLTLGTSARAIGERQQALEWFQLAKRLEQFVGDFEGSQEIIAGADKEIEATEARGI